MTIGDGVAIVACTVSVGVIAVRVLRKTLHADMRDDLADLKAATAATAASTEHIAGTLEHIATTMAKALETLHDHETRITVIEDRQRRSVA